MGGEGEATVGKEAVGILGGDGIDGGRGGGEQVVGGARGSARSCSLILAKASSIGLKSGEYAGRKSSRAPTASMAGRASSLLWALRLSRTTTWPGRRLGARNRSAKAAKAAPVTPRERDGGTDPLRREGGQERHVGTVVAGGVADRSFAPWSAGPTTCQGGVGAGLVDEDKIGGREGRPHRLPGRRAVSSRSVAISDFF